MEGVFAPLTPPLPSQNYAEVRLQVEAFGSKVKLIPALQYSSDGVTWDYSETATLDNGQAWVTVDKNDGTIDFDSWIACPGDWTTSADSTPTEALFVRFGVLAINTTGTKYNSCAARMTPSPKGAPAGSIVGGPVAVLTGGGAAESFSPVCGPSTTDALSKVRATWSNDGNSGDVETRPAYQLSNDGVTWDTAAALGTYSAKTANGTSYAEGVDMDVSTLFENRRLVRFGVLARNTGSGTPPQGCQCSLRIDWRSE